MDNSNDFLNQNEEFYNDLVQKRIVVLREEITNETAIAAVAQLLYLDSEDANADIYLYINSSGGSVSAGMAIYDTIESIQADVATVCIEFAGGIAGLLLAAGAKGKRLALAHSRIMLCPPSVGVNNSPELDAQTVELCKIRQTLNGIMARHTGQPVQKIERDTEQHFFLSAQEALQYGIVDRIADLQLSASNPSIIVMPVSPPARSIPPKQVPASKDRTISSQPKGSQVFLKCISSFITTIRQMWQKLAGHRNRRR
ncbi:ATP-dependent Clp protease proteolytic subunit [Pseudanabaena sp. PCC 6802]|uniref:ATP-dependent Clp protease proteolytic subunit n=1 Tax=Pseudanabaena sp. PCC 6802 TaxID=118173 RepID=UPI0003465CA3|nr:ATP-dependent Clp protease proteolytic subunit [Pseudanabaena sp. PCC 6802]